MIILIADVHSNLVALEMVLGSAQKLKPERIICAGDVVGYGPRPNDCVRRLSEEKVECVKGNHDEASVTGDTSWFNPLAARAAEWTMERLGKWEKRWLERLPLSLETEVYGKRVRVFHGSPANPLREYIYSETPKDKLRLFLKDCDVLVLGHTHVPMIVKLGKKLIINPGAVGQPRDGDPRASFVVVDEEWRVKNKRIAYDVERVASEIYDEGLPRGLGDRLFEGF